MVIETARVLAKVRKEPLSRVEEVTDRNFRRFFFDAEEPR